ncbi:hypothetical protein TorRG33x02_254200 [Trema orientale]|uniref:Uncharacterized protein n=1 Tax=Trema orientale TaxID=63057 RepID=A0A2P5DEA1_TREOI|nr:hypothetical protein TorRG33x02_254200 [Trema orientale]
MNGRLMPRSCSSSALSYFNSGGDGLCFQFVMPSQSCSDSLYSGPQRHRMLYPSVKSVVQTGDFMA